FGLGEIGHEVIFELAGGFEVAGAAMGALSRADVVLEEDGAGRGLGPKAAGVPRLPLAPAIDARAWGVITAMGGAFAALADVLDLGLDRRQPPAEVGVLRLQVGDPSLERGDMGQDGGLGLGSDRVPKRRGDRRLRNHTLYYDAFVQKVRPQDAPGTPIKR